MTQEEQALQRAIEKAGGTAYKLAQLIGFRKQTVYGWVGAKRVKSHEGVLAVERAVGVPRHELRPDIYPE